MAPVWAARVSGLVASRSTSGWSGRRPLAPCFIFLRPSSVNGRSRSSFPVRANSSCSSAMAWRRRRSFIQAPLKGEGYPAPGMDDRGKTWQARDSRSARFPVSRDSVFAHRAREDRSQMTAAQTLKRTPLYDCHLEAGAKMVDFAGWEMPVQYQGVIDEHRAVRTGAGLFDVSHMGEVRVRGEGAEAFLQRLTLNDVSKLTPGRAHYRGLLTEKGTYVDDILIYRLAADDFLVVVNASNAERDFQWIAGRANGEDYPAPTI